MHTLWMEKAPLHHHPRLEGELQADVAVVGAGIAGMTTAWLLQRAGKRVAVIEAGEVGSGETGHTSAHLTAVQDTRWHQIASTFGRESARRLAIGGMEAIALVERLTRELSIDCDFARVPGYLFTESRKDEHELDREVRAAAEAGLAVSRIDEAPLPFATAGAIRFEDQAVFHPIAFLRGLARAFVDAGGQIFTGSRVVSVDDGKPCRVHTAHGSVVARDVVLATDAPIHDRIRMHSKISPYRTYIVTAKIADPLPGLFWDTADPYHYIRTWEAADGPVVIVGGADHRVGAVEDTESRYHQLRSWAEPRFGVRTDACWSGQVNEPADGLPFIGRNPLSLHLYVATGFSGTGLVNGIIAGLVLSEELLDRTHPLARLLAATRFKPFAQAKEAIVHNAENARYMLGDRLVPPSEVRSLDEVPRGEGRLVRLGVERLAVYRSDEGGLQAVSPVCTHLGCYVHWNSGERSWDCPCHGSRFDTAGEVIHGPAVKALAKREIPEEHRPQAPAEEAGEHPA
ncbi:FAD-dependent oxidoreductase [Vulgatibacter sp.]|uniref:FAD-dependent oxidoreductase n=1 Tax=Vulgatibacter sp. TaxID=1971226 RepID=UPI00356953B4